MKIYKIFFFKYAFILIFTFLLLFLKANPIHACECGYCASNVPSPTFSCCACGSGGGENPYEHPPEGSLDALNCNEIAGWACDPSCTGNNPPCATTINVFDQVIPWRLKNDNDPVIRVGIPNCTSCDWGQTGNFSTVYCGRCPGNCSGIQCNYAWAHKLVLVFTSNNVNRPDLANVGACRGTTQHGFSIRTPSQLIDGKTHYLTFIANNQGSGYNVSLTGNQPRDFTCQKPTCSLSLNKNSATSNQSNTITITFSGKAYNKDIQLWVRRLDAKPVSQLANGAIYINEVNSYLIKTCNPGNSSGCTVTYTLPNDLPLGDYSVHCSTDGTAGGRCNGSTRCDYYGGPVNCTADDWRPCSSTDHASFSIANPTPTQTPTPTRTLTPTPTRIPTATPVPGCECNSSSICTNVCPVYQATNRVQGVSYPSEIKCSLVNSLNIPTPATAQQKNNWCNRSLRLKGDADGNELVNELDYLYYLRAVLRAPLPSSVNPDFNGDGDVTTADLLIWQQAPRQ